MPRITPRPIPPTITHGSGLSREWVQGSLHSDETRSPGLIRALILVFLVVVIGSAIFPN